MEDIKQYLLPYIISNLLFGLSVWAALRKPLLARFFYAGFFLWASVVNATTAIRSPEVYLEYAQFSFVPVYRRFIQGFFSEHIRAFVLTIASGQFLIFAGLLFRDPFTRIACLGGMVFGIAIGPLGVGSAFPATLLMAAGFYFLFRKYGHKDIWKIRQYNR